MAAMNACQAFGEHCMAGPAGSTESRTMMAVRTDAISTHAPLLTLRRDFRHAPPGMSTSVDDISALSLRNGRIVRPHGTDMLPWARPWAAVDFCR